MRRKSERAKKTKASPEKTEKSKKGRTTRRRKASSSSDEESAEESSPPTTQTKVPEVEPSESQSLESQNDEKVWQVKSDDSSGTGEIKKLKICLSTRLPVTPEPEVTPRSRRKLNRTVSETPNEVSEEKRRRHKSRRSTRESRDSAVPETPSEDDDQKGIKFDQEVETQEPASSEPIPEVPPSESVVPPNESDVPPNEAVDNIVHSGSSESVSETKIDKTDDAGSTIERNDDMQRKIPPLTPISKRRRSRRLSGSSPEREPSPEPSEQAKLPQISEEPEPTQSEMINNVQHVEESEDKEETNVSPDIESGTKVVEIVSHESQSENREQKEIKTDIEETKNGEDEKEIEKVSDVTDPMSTNVAEESFIPEKEVMNESTNEKTKELKSKSASPVAMEAHTTQGDESDEVFETKQSGRDKYFEEKDDSPISNSNEEAKNQFKEDEPANDIAKVTEEPPETYNATPIVVSRKRRWGARVSKTSTSKPVSISTDILKDIIPDVKPAELEEAIEDKRQRKKSESIEKHKMERPVLPKIIIDNSENANLYRREKEAEQKEKIHDSHLMEHRKISIVKEDKFVARPPSPARHKTSSVLFISNLVRPFTLAQLKNLLQRTGKIVQDGFWIDRIKSKCFVTYENEEQAVETRHALHGVTWPVSNPKTLQVDFSSAEALDKMRAAEEQSNDKPSAIPGTVEDWLREQDAKKDKFGENDPTKPWDKRNVVREWDVGKNEKDKDKLKKDERPLEKRRNRSTERSPEPARKFKKKEEEAPAKLLDDLFRKTKSVPCIYWLPLSDETIAVKEEQRRQHMAEHERRMQELERSRTHRRH